MGPRRQGRIRLSRSRQLSATIANRQEIALAVFTHPATNHQDHRRPRAHLRQRVVAELLAVLSDRGSEFTSAACVDGRDRLGCGVPWAALGRA
jgi:deoxyribodipyrimidine photolyase